MNLKSKIKLMKSSADPTKSARGSSSSYSAQKWKDAIKSGIALDQTGHCLTSRPTVRCSLQANLCKDSNATSQEWKLENDQKSKKAKAKQQDKKATVAGGLWNKMQKRLEDLSAMETSMKYSGALRASQQSKESQRSKAAADRNNEFYFDQECGIDNKSAEQTPKEATQKQPLEKASCLLSTHLVQWDDNSRNMSNYGSAENDDEPVGKKKVQKQKISRPMNVLSLSSNQLQNNNAVIEFNNSQSPQEPLMTSSRQKHNQSPSQEESHGMPIQITDQRQLSDRAVEPPLLDSEFDQQPQYGRPQKLQLAPLDSTTLQSQNNQGGGSSSKRDESPQQRGSDTAVTSLRNQSQRQSQPEWIVNGSAPANAAMSGGAGSAMQVTVQQTPVQQQSKRSSPGQNARQFIIRNTTQNYSVPTQQGVHQPKVLPPGNRGQPITKKGKTPMLNGPASQSFQLNSRPAGVAGSKKASPIDGFRDGHLRRLSQNQNSINTYLEQESKFDSTKDASDLGGAGGPGTKDYASSLPDSIKVKGSGGGQHDQRSYDEAWQVDQGSQNSCQHGEVSCDKQRLDSAQTSILNKRRPSGNRLNNDFFDGSVENEQLGATTKSKKQMQHLSQPRTKEYARKAQHMRGTLQSQNQNRFADQMIDDEYAQMAPLNPQHEGMLNQGQPGAGHKNYNSPGPAQLREMGLSQQMVPNQMKQQLKQRRTVYGQSFFNSPPYPASSQHFGAVVQPHLPDTMAEAQASPGGTAAPTDGKTRNAQMDSSLRRKRQLPVPTTSNLMPSNKPTKHHHRLMSGSSQIQQPQPPQSQQRKTLQKHIDSAAQHIEFDERQQNEGKISQLSRFNAYQAGMRNVLTAGENSPRVVDHFPVSRASRWKPSNQNPANMPPSHHATGSNVYDHMVHMDTDGFGTSLHPEVNASQSPHQQHHTNMPGIGRHYQLNPHQFNQQMHAAGGIPPPLFQDLNEKRSSQGVKHRGGGSRGFGGGAKGLQQHNPTNQQLHHNTKNLPKRSGTASYITQGGVRITINKDNKHLNGANLTTQTEENMNLMFYDFNNNNNPANQVIPEESQRNVLRSQTTDRGPSRKLRSRGRFKLASSNQQKRGDQEDGLGDVRPFGVSTDFEMGMYPPDSSHMAGDDLAQDSMQMMPNEVYHINTQVNNTTIHSSLQMKPDEDGSARIHTEGGCSADDVTTMNATGYQKNQRLTGSGNNRNIQGKRLSSQTIVQQRQSQGSKHGHRPLHGNQMISSHQVYQEQQQNSESPSQRVKKGQNSLVQSAGDRRVQKQYRAADGTTSANSKQGVVVLNSSHQTSSAKAHHRSSIHKSSGAQISKGNKGSQGHHHLHHSDEQQHQMQHNQQAAQQVQQMSHHNHHHSSGQPSRLPQHRQTNLANVMESIREEDTHL